MFEESCTSRNSCLYTDVIICEHCLHRNCLIETLEEAASTISAMQSLFADDENKRDGLLGCLATRVQTEDFRMIMTCTIGNFETLHFGSSFVASIPGMAVLGRRHQPYLRWGRSVSFSVENFSAGPDHGWCPH
jgi:hypothetical protein